MHLLELLYEKEFKNISIVPRKLSLDENKIILCGPRGSGKSYLIYDYLQFESYGSYLYIDFCDFRVGKIDKDALYNFCEEKKISTLVLENFDFSFEPPDVLKTIITTTSFRQKKGFHTKILYPLDFEEFISFDKKFVSERITFNLFSQRGTYPFVVTSKKENYEKNFQQMLKSFFDCEVEFEVLKFLSLRQSNLVTLLELYSKIKDRLKISKDRFYQIIKKLQDQMYIFLISKYKKNSYKKKLYLIDFTIRGVMSYEKDFIKRFENIVFLELLKREEEIFYDDVVDFVIPNKSLGVLVLPFLPEGMILNKIKILLPALKKLDIKKIKIVTLDPLFNFEKDGIIFEVLPFWNFALES